MYNSVIDSFAHVTHRFISPEYPPTLSSGDGDRSGGHVGVDDWFSHQQVDVIVKVSMDVFLQERQGTMIPHSTKTIIKKSSFIVITEIIRVP